MKKVTLAHTLAEWSDDNATLVKALASRPDVTSLHDVALRYNVSQLAELVGPTPAPEPGAGPPPDEKKRDFAIGLRQKLFRAEPTAVLQRMVQDHEVPIASTPVRAGVVDFLNKQPDFNIRTTSVYTALRKPDALKDIPADQRAPVIENLKTLQRVQAISPVPEAIPVLMKANLTTAFGVTELPQSTFLRRYGTTLGETVARQVYTNAVNARLRNEYTLTTMREAIRGSGLAIIDGPESREQRLRRLQGVADQHAAPVNLDTLFGGMDYCECGECNSVYGAASYFVELLQFLRNNDLDPSNPHTSQKGIANTPLEKLFRRRPDLGCLELTCENTNTVLPYIDLANEVMESFIVHQAEYDASSTDPTQRQTVIEAFNVEDETTGELLTQPQHINYKAYCVLKSAVYPFTLPYHQPIDAIRIFLNYLGTSRYQLLDTFRSTPKACNDPAITPAESDELKTLHKQTLDRAVDAEFLGLTQEEYIILTKEAFWPKRYFEITQHKTFTDDEYRQKIGVQSVPAYYGYDTEAHMLSTDEGTQTGLTFVKKQFLRRTGIAYVDLVELLRTRFINPLYPQGQALTLMEDIRFSYRFLQTLVDTSSKDPKVRFAKLIDFLEKSQPLVPLIEARLHPDPCKQQDIDWCMQTQELREWVYCYFERVGRLIVLESGDKPMLPIDGTLTRLVGERREPFGRLLADGTIVGADGKTAIGNVTIVVHGEGGSSNSSNGSAVLLAGPVKWADGKSFPDEVGSAYLEVRSEYAHDPIGYIMPEGVYRYRRELQFTWFPPRDTCDLDKVRLTHLDGSAVTVEEYDHIQRFIRLWHKLGWTIAEVDQALIGLGTGTSGCPAVGFDAFTDACADGSCGDGAAHGDGECGAAAAGAGGTAATIAPAFLHQLVAIKQLLDLTGLPLAKLLTFWADIGTRGEKSLYVSLFLTHNVRSIDPVFQADANGNYLTQSAKLSEHIPVLMAALKLKADDIAAVVSYRQLPDSLTLASVSTIYRHGLLARLLHVKVADLPEVFNLFQATDPFQNAEQALAFFQDWGRMEDAGLTFRQLDYLVRNTDDPDHPLAPSQQKVLQTSKTLYDGLNGIDHDHADVPADRPDLATADLIRAQAALLFEPPVVERILGLLEGTALYTTNAPTGLLFAHPENMPAKVKYADQKNAVPPTATVQVKGILSDAEAAAVKAMSPNPKWSEAIDRVRKQPQNVFNADFRGARNLPK